jgi:16S rRNA (uracil1498-N3)-methyltransferase
MQIDPLTLLPSCMDAAPKRSVYLAPTAPTALAAIESQVSELALFIGPEGGWTPDELELFMTRNIVPARLTDSILRIETAAIAAAAVAQCVLVAAFSNPSR